MSTQPILVTGGAGFIGAHVMQALSKRGETVHGLDNFNDYYDPQLKHDRVAALCPDAPMHRIDLADAAAMQALFAELKPKRVIHLAAQAGVRYSITNPQVYTQSNLVGFMNVVECCRHAEVAHLVYASSSSVYGGSASLPFSEQAIINQPISLYAATKIANEVIAASYAHLYGLPCTGLRFFTVYGPWGRPDMAPLIFSRAVLAKRSIDIFGDGQQSRDFTFIDDIVSGVLAALDRPPVNTTPKHRVFNLGNDHPSVLMDFIRIIEQAAGGPAILNHIEQQPGDMRDTAANIAQARTLLGFNPSTRIDEGLPKVVDWCQSYFDPSTL